MSKVRLTGSNSGYVEISALANAGNLTFTMPNSGTSLLGNSNNTLSGVTTTGQLDINGSIDVSSTSVFNDDLTLAGASYNVLWDKSDNQLEFGDNAKAAFGGSSDLQIYHDGNHSHIVSNTGNLRILADGSGSLVLTSKSGEEAITCAQDGAVLIKHDNATKFRTTNTGAIVTGICTATSFSGSGENLTRTTPLSHRNKFINGSFAIWQRGTSSTSTGYLSDRWYFGLSGGSATCSRQEHSGSQANFSGSQYSLRLAVTSSSDYIGIRQRIEDVRTLPEGQITVSFWARGHVNGNLAVWMTQGFGSGGSTDVDIAQQVAPYLQNDSTFRYYSLTFTVPSISGKTIGAGSFFQISFGQGTNSSASAWTLDISNIQVEVGSVATPFEHRSIGDELLRCQRYYQQIGPASSSRYVLTGAGNGNSRIRGVRQLVPEMRAAPTANHDTSSESPSFYSYSGSPPSYTSVNSITTTTKDFAWDFNTATHNQAGHNFDVKGSGAFITLTAEL